MEVLKDAKIALRLCNLSNKNGLYLSKWRIPNWIVDFLLLLPMFICAIQMVMFCVKTGPSLKEISSSIYLELGILSILAIYICLAVNNDLIIATLDHLQKVVTLRINSSAVSAAYYAKGERRNVKIMKIFMIYSFVGPVMIFGLPFLFPILYVIFGFPKPNHWNLPYPTVVPFDTDTPLGFSAILVLQFLSGTSYVLIVSSFSGFYIGMCSYIDTCVTDLTTFADDINGINEKKPTFDNQRIFDELCSDMLQFHIDILQLMENLKRIMNGPLFFQLLVYTVFIAMNLLQFDETFKHFDFDILLNLNSLLLQILFNYMSCYNANNVTIKSFAAAEIAYSMHWYTFPVKRQRLIMQMVRRAQKPFYLKGYDIVDCSLTTFANFIKSAVSFYLVFKQFGN